VSTDLLELEPAALLREQAAKHNADIQAILEKASGEDRTLDEMEQAKMAMLQGFRDDANEKAADIDAARSQQVTKAATDDANRFAEGVTKAEDGDEVDKGKPGDVIDKSAIVRVKYEPGDFVKSMQTAGGGTYQEWAEAFIPANGGPVTKESPRFTLATDAMKALGARLGGAVTKEEGDGLITTQGTVLAPNDPEANCYGPGIFADKFKLGIIEKPRPDWEKLLRLFTIRTTPEKTIQWMEKKGFVNNAAAHIEAKFCEDPAALKKQSGPITWSQHEKTVKQIAHWMPVTTQALKCFPILEQLIQTELIDGLWEKLALQMIFGDPATNQDDILTGLLNTPGIAMKAYEDGQPVSKMIRKGITAPRAAGYGPNGIIMNPQDCEKLECESTDPCCNVYYNPVTGQATPTVHGLQKCETPFIPPGFAIIGDFSQAQLWLHGGVEYDKTNSHGYDFAYNINAHRAQLDAMNCVPCPEGFCIVELCPAEERIEIGEFAGFASGLLAGA